MIQVTWQGLVKDEVFTREEVGKPITVHVYTGAELTSDVVERIKLHEPFPSIGWKLHISK